MSVGTRLKTKQRMIQVLDKAQQILMKKKKEHIIKLAWQLGYTSPDYFKRSVLPVITMLSDCIEVDGDYVKWVCNEEGEVVTDNESSVFEAQPIEVEDESKSEVSWGSEE